MAAKAGGVYINLALQTADFDPKVEKSVAQMRKLDKAQDSINAAVGRVNMTMGRQSTLVTQMVVSNLKLSSSITATVGLLATTTQQYFVAMKGAAEKAGVAFNQTQGMMKAGMLAFKANWVALTVAMGTEVIKATTAIYLTYENKAAKATAALIDSGRKLYADLIKLRDDAASAEARVTYQREVGRKSLVKATLYEGTLEEALADKKLRRDKEEFDRVVTHITMRDKLRAISEKDAAAGEKAIARGKALVKEQDEAAQALAKHTDEAQKQEKKQAEQIEKLAEKKAERLKDAVDLWQKMQDKARQYFDIVIGKSASYREAQLNSMGSLGMLPGVAGQSQSGLGEMALAGDQGAIKTILEQIAINTGVEFAL